MDDLDKKLLTIIQTGFPIASHPYRVLAQQLDITEDEALDRVRNLVDTGIIRKIGLHLRSANSVTQARWSRRRCLLTDCRGSEYYQ